MAQGQWFGWPVNLDEAQLGRHATSLFSLFGGTATSQPTSGDQAIVSSVTLLTPFNSGSFTTLVVRVEALTILANELRRSLISLGIIKGS
jgi:hypothetical protein